MASETCPHCGAERSGLTSDGRFACGTLGGSRSPFCYSQQLATVTAERDELRRRLAEAPVRYMTVFKNGRLGVRFYFRKATADAVAMGTSLSVSRIRLVRDDQPQP